MCRGTHRSCSLVAGLAVAVQAVQHEPVLVELCCRLLLIAPPADLQCHGSASSDASWAPLAVRYLCVALHNVYQDPSGCCSLVEDRHKHRRHMCWHLSLYRACKKHGHPNKSLVHDSEVRTDATAEGLQRAKSGAFCPSSDQTHLRGRHALLNGRQRRLPPLAV